MSISAEVPRRIVFLALALNQTRFYIGVAKALRALGVESVVVSLHESSQEMVRAAGFPVVNFFEHVRSVSNRVIDLVPLFKRFEVENVNRVISHEKVAYEIRDSRLLVRKFAAYLAAAEEICTLLRAKAGGDIDVVQELGGFLSVVAMFHVARHLGLGHTFIEPSFFLGRVFLLPDFAPPHITPSERDAGQEVVRYLEETLRERRIVIPAKDADHYRSALRKILSGRNLRRLAQKTAEKYLRGQREEFTHIRWQARRHARMLLTDVRLRRAYRPLPDRPFIYYPFHVAADVALTVRAPAYLDQYALLDYLARGAPVTHLIAVKEHPAMVGGVNYDRTRDLLRRHDNLVLLPPGLNNLDVMSRAAAVVTVNSKSGAEAILINRPVLALGDSFYRHSGLVETVRTWEEIPDALGRLVAAPPRPEAVIRRFFQAVWDHSYPGELYDDQEANCRTFAASLIRALDVLTPSPA